MKSLEEHIKEALKCVRCGACKSVCPSFDVRRREPSSPRGRVALIEASLKGEEGLGGMYVGHIKECTLCGSCLNNCPNGVDVPGLVMAARAEHVRREGLSPVASFALRNMLSSDRFMPWALKLASKLQGLFLKSSSVENGLVSRFSLPFIGGGRLLPELAGVFFMDRRHVRALSEAKGDSSKPRIGFFVGCGVNYLLPDIGESTVRVLNEAGAEVVVPSGQVCCGMPALSTGDVKTARSLALKNLEAFEQGEYDYIVTSCATCGHGLKNIFRELLSDEEDGMSARVERFSSRVKDITELLEGILSYKGRAGEGSGDRVVTYHDPCHLRKYQGISEEPRLLLEKTGLRFKGMKNPCKCCGLGGGLAFSNYELSMEIARKKAEGVRGCGADIVATACPGCIIQLKDALHRYGVRAKVVHVVELL